MLIAFCVEHYGYHTQRHIDNMPIQRAQRPSDNGYRKTDFSSAIKNS